MPDIGRQGECRCAFCTSIPFLGTLPGTQFTLGATDPTSFSRSAGHAVPAWHSPGLPKAAQAPERAMRRPLSSFSLTINALVRPGQTPFGRANAFSYRYPVGSQKKLSAGSYRSVPAPVRRGFATFRPGTGSAP